MRIDIFFHLKNKEVITLDKVENIVYTIAEETLTEKDYEKMIPLLNTKVELYGKIRWFFQMKNFTGWTPKALWEDIKFDVKNADNLEKIAMVGEKTWQDMMTDIIKPFTSANVKYFKESEVDKAKKWIEE